MSRAVIGFPRWTNECSYSGGAWSSTYPLLNLTQLPLSFVARSVSAALADTQVVGVLNKNRPVRLFAICRHNLTIDAQFRLRLYYDSLRNELLYDTGWTDVWPAVYASDQLEWESDNWWTGKYSSEEIAGYVWSRPIWLPQLFGMQSFHLEISDTSNPDEAVDIGLIETSQGWEVGINLAIGAQQGFRHRTTSVEALGGVKYFDRQNSPRHFLGTLQYLPHQETMSRAFESQRQSGLDQPFYWLPFPDESMHWLRKSFLARHIDPGLLTYALATFDNVPLSFEEVL